MEHTTTTLLGFEMTGFGDLGGGLEEDVDSVPPLPSLSRLGNLTSRRDIDDGVDSPLTRSGNR